MNEPPLGDPRSGKIHSVVLYVGCLPPSALGGALHHSSAARYVAGCARALAVPQWQWLWLEEFLLITHTSCCLFDSYLA